MSTDIAGLARDVLREEWEPSSDSAQFLANSAPALARQVQADAKRIAELEAALKPFAAMDRSGGVLDHVVLDRGTGCTKTILTESDFRAAAIALQLKEQPHDPS